MTLSLDVRQKQRAVIEFFALAGELPTNILKRLEKVYGDAVIGYSTVKKGVSRIKSEEEDLSLSGLWNKQKSGKPSSAAVNTKNWAKVKKWIKKIAESLLMALLNILE